MKKAIYKIDEQTLWAVVIRVDENTSKDCRQSTFIGYNIKDAIRNANKRLNVFGYEIEEVTP